jgi:hypothetical protein
MENMVILNMAVNGVSGVSMAQFRSNVMPIRMAVEKIATVAQTTYPAKAALARRERKLATQ